MGTYEVGGLGEPKTGESPNPNPEWGLGEPKTGGRSPWRSTVSPKHFMRASGVEMLRIGARIRIGVTHTRLCLGVSSLYLHTRIGGTSSRNANSTPGKPSAGRHKPLTAAPNPTIAEGSPSEPDHRVRG